MHTYFSKAPNPGNITGLTLSAFLDGLSCVLTFKSTCPGSVYSYPGTHSAFLCYGKESLFPDIPQEYAVIKSCLSLEDLVSALVPLLSFDI